MAMLRWFDVLPSRALLGGVLLAAALATVALIAGVAVERVGLLITVAAILAVCATLLDLMLSARAWQRAPLLLDRVLPAALALGVPAHVRLVFTNPAGRRWRARVFDHADPTLTLAGLPLAVAVGPGERVVATYSVTPQKRGELFFLPAELRVASRWRLLELRRRIGATQAVRAYPNFAAVARYAWLAADRRLTEIGIKTYAQRGEGTDFKELTEYRPGESLRHIDWKATLKLQRPIVREFQDERDQNVVFLLDCGRRMRADETGAEGVPVLSHFDHALNAVMLLAYVALKQGDAVGALTFGHEPGTTPALFAPRKGMSSFNALLAALYAVQPQPAFSDYLLAAGEVMARLPKRSLIVLITNFRDEDAAELAPALKLLRTRHLVIAASLRERVVRALVEQPLAQAETVFGVAGAHLYEQARRDAFTRLAARDALLIDVEPEQLPVELVNRYHAVKRAGLL
ncbi:MAG TPA: DUF58 domain-containing protein [Burkholderiaceae bacterium]|nr:DUF58 domain-containing protein [Burkholderiaceae bacterium]